MIPKFTKDYCKKVEAYLAEGKPWKARDCLMGYFSQIKYDEAMYRLAGHVFWEMDEKERAGLYWALTTEESPDVDEAIHLAQEKYGSDLHKRIYVYVKPSELPKSVRDRLRSVFKEAGVVDVEKVFARNCFVEKERLPQETLKQKLVIAGCFVVVFIFCVGLFGAAVNGLIFLFELIF